MQAFKHLSLIKFPSNLKQLLSILFWVVWKCQTISALELTTINLFCSIYISIQIIFSLRSWQQSEFLNIF